MRPFSIEEAIDRPGRTEDSASHTNHRPMDLAAGSPSSVGLRTLEFESSCSTHPGQREYTDRDGSQSAQSAAVSHENERTRGIVGASLPPRRAEEHLFDRVEVAPSRSCRA